MTTKPEGQTAMNLEAEKQPQAAAPSPEVVKQAEETARANIQAETAQQQQARAAREQWARQQVDQFVARGMSPEHAKAATIEILKAGAAFETYSQQADATTAALIEGMSSGRITPAQAKEMFERGAQLADVQNAIAQGKSAREQELEQQLAELQGKSAEQTVEEQRSAIAGGITLPSNNPGESAMPTKFDDAFFIEHRYNPYETPDELFEAYRREHPELDPAAQMAAQTQ